MKTKTMIQLLPTDSNESSNHAHFHEKSSKKHENFPTNNNSSNFSNDFAESDNTDSYSNDDSYDGGDDDDHRTTTPTTSTTTTKTSVTTKTRMVIDCHVRDNRGRSGTYTGPLDVETNQPHGSNGKMIYKEHHHQIYEGEWYMGKKSGHGVLKYTDTGDVYTGQFMNDMRHGEGRIQYSNGRTYNGIYCKNRKEKGIMTYPDKSSYWGYWSEDGQLPHGRGKFTYFDGGCYDGEFVNGMRHGHGKMTWPGGSWYLGQWEHDTQHGKGKESSKDGSLTFEGKFSHGRPIQKTNNNKDAKKKSNEKYQKTFVVKRSANIATPLETTFFFTFSK